MMKVAVRIHQVDVRPEDVEGNAGLICDLIAENRGQADLLLFPECALSGYCLDREGTTECARSLDNSAVGMIRRASEKDGATVVFGMLESAGTDVYNSAVVLAAGRFVQVYRKIHLPYMGVDRYVARGDRVESPFTVNGVRFGVGICYDYRFPEIPRIHALRDADCMLLITNWPEGSEPGARILCPAHALASKFYFVACNRVGTEAGIRFLGMSAAYGPDGGSLACLKKFEPDMADVIVDTEQSRCKEYAEGDGMLTEILADRAPHTYGQIVLDDGRLDSRSIQDRRNIPLH